MATNFPDTSVNNPSTGVLWAEGDSYSDPETGLTYYWYPPVWKTGFSPTGATDAKYVEVAGDNMTGDLTLGTDKITLDATDGSATFAGEVTMGAGGAPYTNNTVTVNPDGYIWAQRDGSNLWVGVDGTGTGTSSINSDGSASFAGNITAGNVSFNLEPDNDANYVTTTDVDEEGNTVETRVYNGPTLDVKAVIQELQQRVADRDAVIADLTTRIAALEAA